ncbi:MAG: ASKHA domain-containing protein [Methanomassiliicoccales archaeon]
MYSVTFFPKNVTVEVEKGTTILDAAFEAGVSIDSVCGGKGTCGRCKVIVDGAVSSPETELIDEGEWENGYRLACQTEIMSDAIVFVPQRAQVGEHKILASFHLAEIERLDPMVSAAYLEMRPPSLDDNLGDLERIDQAMGKGAGELNVPLDLLRSLSSTIREGDWKVTAFSDTEDRLVRLCPGDLTDRYYGLAVDIGTTTVVVSLVNLARGEIVSQASDYNKQLVCGEDILSRIAFTEECDLKRPHGLVIDTLDHLIGKTLEVDEAEGIGREDIVAMSVAGNTTMMHLFMGIHPKTIRYEPYIATTNVPPLFRASDLGIGICPEAPIFCVPGRASFVGGDIVADVLASDLYREPELSMMIDVGTNGEIVLGNQDWMVACSCSAGPAFEGGEVGFGMRAMTGAIDSVSIEEDCEIEYTTINDAPPRGICGSGLIDLMARMFFHQMLDKKGNILEVDSDRVRKQDDGREVVLAWANESGFGRDNDKFAEEPRDIVVTDNDIANVIRTKGAVYAGCSVLLKSMNLSFEDLDRLFVAGGFGNYVDIDNAVTIGLLPDIPRERFVFLGNGALAGSRLTLLSGEKRRDSLDIYQSMTYFELSTTQVFFDEFSSALFLPHTEISQFPTVRGWLNERG